MAAKFEKSDYYKYIKDNKITNPDIELFIRYAKMKGQTEEEMRQAVKPSNMHIVDKVYSKEYKNDLPQDGKSSSTNTVKPNNKTKPHDSLPDELSSAQIKNLNKVKDMIRTELSAKQQIDLRRYLSNE